jgi:hypothetical protein
MYRNSSQSVAGTDPGTHNGSVLEKHFISLMISGPLPLRQEQLAAPVVVVCALHNFVINV